MRVETAVGASNENQGDSDAGLECYGLHRGRTFVHLLVFQRINNSGANVPMDRSLMIG